MTFSDFDFIHANRLEIIQCNNAISVVIIKIFRLLFLQTFKNIWANMSVNIIQFVHQNSDLNVKNTTYLIQL